GFTLASAWSQPGIEAMGTNAELANTNGKIDAKLAAWVDSTSRMDRPKRAESHENACPNAIASRMAPTAARKPPLNRNPIAYPTAVISSTTNRFRTEAETVRPVSTAQRARGRDRNPPTPPRDTTSPNPTPDTTA